MRKLIKSLICLLILVTLTGCGKEYTVTFYGYLPNEDNENIVSTQTVKEGEKVIKPNDYGHPAFGKFAGWFLNDEPFDFDNYVVNSDLKIKAKPKYLIEFYEDETGTKKIGEKEFLKGELFNSEGISLISDRELDHWKCLDSNAVLYDNTDINYSEKVSPIYKPIISYYFKDKLLKTEVYSCFDFYDWPEDIFIDGYMITNWLDENGNIVFDENNKPQVLTDTNLFVETVRCDSIKFVTIFSPRDGGDTVYQDTITSFVGTDIFAMQDHLIAYPSNYIIEKGKYTIEIEDTSIVDWAKPLDEYGTLGNYVAGKNPGRTNVTFKAGGYSATYPIVISNPDSGTGYGWVNE